MKAIVSRILKDGSFPEVGMNDRTIFSCSMRQLDKKAREFGGDRCVRVEVFSDNNIYGKPSKVYFFGGKQ